MQCLCGNTMDPLVEDEPEVNYYTECMQCWSFWTVTLGEPVLGTPIVPERAPTTIKVACPLCGESVECHVVFDGTEEGLAYMDWEGACATHGPLTIVRQIDLGAFVQSNTLLEVPYELY